MLSDLQARLQSQGTIPPLPEAWRSQSAMIAASGVGFGGDFLVAHLTEDDRRLELILVDVCGKGVGAASRALQFGGALGGLIGALPPQGLFEAANDFLLRQRSDETFATAVHVTLDLATGDYGLTSAGHPPALVWSADVGRPGASTAPAAPHWASCRRPRCTHTRGRLEPGDALMFYTDGVVETRHTDLDAGVAWLQQEAARRRSRTASTVRPAASSARSPAATTTARADPRPRPGRGPPARVRVPAAAHRRLTAASPLRHGPTAGICHITRRPTRGHHGAIR